MQRHNDHIPQPEERARALLAACEVRPSPDFTRKVLARARAMAQADDAPQPVPFQDWRRRGRLIAVLSTFGVWWHETIEAVRALLSPVPADWQHWFETVAGEVWHTIAPTQSWFLPAVCRTPSQRPVPWWLPRWGSSASYFRHPGTEGSKMSAVLAVLKETTHKLQAFHPGASPAAVAHRLTPAQRAEVAAHIRSAVRRRHLSETEARCLEETVARYLSGANASGGGLV